MSLQESTFKTAHVLDNEIIKASDFEFAFEQLVVNVAKATQMLMESDQDFVINGKVLPDNGMNVKVSPIYGVCKSTGLPFGRTEETDETIGFAGSNAGRVDILMVKGDWETYDEQQRAFNDPDTDTQTYQYIDTKKLMKPIYEIKQGVEGSDVAPEVDSGWVKLAEVTIRAGASSVEEDDIHNITADVAGVANVGWTTQPTITYNIGYISDVNARFRVQHNEDGTHADDCINSDSLDIGTGVKQVNGNVLPVGESVTLPTGTIIGSESIKSAITAVAAVVTTIYNTYLKYGSYGFKGTLAVSSIADANNNLTKPITITAAGDGTAVIKIDGATVLSIDSTGKLSTNGYTATASNHIVTKAVTDAISSSITALTTRVSNLEQAFTGNQNYTNKTISTDRYNTLVSVPLATTENITLSGAQTIDGVTPENGTLILVKDQTNQKENGIYSYSNNSAWGRANGYLSPSAFLHKLIQVDNGTVNKGKIFFEPDTTFTDSAAFGSDNIEFVIFIASIEKNLANKLIMRDSGGHGKVASICTNCEGYIATRDEINALYGNVVGTALGTAAVGTATTFARSDHVHPITNIFTGIQDISNYPGFVLNGQNGRGDLHSDYAYFRTPYGGFIPYCNDTVNGQSYVGTPDWPFKEIHAKCFVGNLTGTASFASSLTNTLTIAGGGTGATTAPNAFNNLVHDIPIYNGSVGGDASLLLHLTGSCYDNCYQYNRICICDIYGVGGANLASHLYINNAGNNGVSTWNWCGQSGQPSWVWGANEPGSSMYVWNPSCFCVSYACCAKGLEIFENVDPYDLIIPFTDFNTCRCDGRFFVTCFSKIMYCNCTGELRILNSSGNIFGSMYANTMNATCFCGKATNSDYADYALNAFCIPLRQNNVITSYCPIWICA